MRFAVIMLAALSAPCAALAADVTIFAAASLTGVVARMAEAFEADTGLKADLAFAASSVLARQVRNGAPADVIVSANARWIDYLAESDAAVAATRRMIAANSLALVRRRENGAPAMALAELAAGGEALIAMGDPDHAPVGLYARQSLQTLRLWEAVRPRLIRAGNARAAIAFVQRGAVGYGLVYRTDALAFDDIEMLQPLPEDSHDPVRYQAAATAKGMRDNAANTKAFLDFLGSARAAAIFESAGFVPCSGGAC